MRLILFAIGVFLLPTSVAAQALSPWVQGILDKSQLGMTAASGAPYQNCDNETVVAAILDNRSIVRSTQSALSQLEAESEFVWERTSCFQYDRRLLAEQLRVLEEEMNAATDACQIGRNDMLKSVYLFTADAYQSLLRGGTDPSYKDDRLWKTYPFEDVNIWSSGQGAFYSTDAAPLCPFTTDYAPHSIAYVPTSVGNAVPLDAQGTDIRSFGCDAGVLKSLTGPASTEAAIFADFVEKTEAASVSLYTLVSQALHYINTTLGVITGVSPNPGGPPPIAPPPHQTLSGCLKPFPPDINSGASAEEVELLLSAYPDFFHPKNLRDIGNGNVTYDPLPNEILPTGLLFHGTFNFFRTTPSSNTLLRNVQDKRSLIGFDRPLPLAMINAEFDSFYAAFARQAGAQNDLQNITSNLERSMSNIETISRDGVERLQDASQPLDSAVRSLVYVVDEFLPKEYVPGLTYFLARSCVDGYCQRTLDTVGKRILNPYCHPYVSGKYADEKAAEKCFCTPEFANEPYCLGGTVDLSSQPQPPLQCGVPLP